MRYDRAAKPIGMDRTRFRCRDFGCPSPIPTRRERRTRPRFAHSDARFRRPRRAGASQRRSWGSPVAPSLPSRTRTGDGLVIATTSRATTSKPTTAQIHIPRPPIHPSIRPYGSYYSCSIVSLLVIVRCGNGAADYRNRLCRDLHGCKQRISPHAFRRLTSMHVSFLFCSS